MHLRVLTWNIHKGIGGVDRRYRLDRIIEVLREADADVLLLQEVADGWDGAGGDYQPELLREALDYPLLAFKPEHRFKTGGYGNAILSRFPLHEVHHIDLTISWKKKRGALLAKMITREESGQNTWVIANMHLGLAGSEREQQLGRFFECEPFRGLHGSTPVIVGGDLNDLYGTLGPKILEPRGFRRMGPRTSTFPAFLPLRPLDGIFARGPVHYRTAHIEHPELGRASDHLPLVARVSDE